MDHLACDDGGDDVEDQKASQKEGKDAKNAQEGKHGLQNGCRRMCAGFGNKAGEYRVATFLDSVAENVLVSLTSLEPSSELDFFLEPFSGE